LRDRVGEAKGRGLGDGVTRLATVESYLARLPGGMHAYPECMHQGEALSIWLRGSPTSALVERLPHEAGALLSSADHLPVWIPEVHATVLYLAIREAHFPDDAAFLAHAREVNRRLLDTPTNRVLFWVVSPRDMLRAAGPRWSTLHRGSSVNVRIRGDSSAEVELGFPAHLLPEIVLRGNATGFAAALERTGACEVVVEVREVESTRARFRADWR
jgi:uncharacterized protein (TIGR02265 family)